MVQRRVSDRMFREAYADVFKGDELWARIGGAGGRTYAWDETSTYVRLPPYFVGMAKEPAVLADIKGARILAVLGDSITTDHISPAGSIAKDSPAGRYLIEHGVMPVDFNSYGARAATTRSWCAARSPTSGFGTRWPTAGTAAGRADAGRRADDHLRRRDEVPGAGHAARGDRRQGVRLGFIARLGRQGRQPARRQGGDRRELRAHPPLESGRHGRPAAHLQGWPEPQIAAARRQRHHRPARHRWRHHARHGRRLHHPPLRRRERKDHADLPDRHPRRGRLFPPRRHPAFRAAPTARAGRTRRPRRPRRSGHAGTPRAARARLLWRGLCAVIGRPRLASSIAALPDPSSVRARGAAGTSPPA